MKFNTSFLVVAVLSALALASCRTSDAAEKSRTPAVDDVASALRDGRIRFEVRGLHNEPTTETVSGSSGFLHKGTVIAVGDSALGHQPMFVFFNIKRVSGGDPRVPRGADELVSVTMRGGVGDILASGGYRTSLDKWNPEVIELSLVGAVPFVPLSGAPIREQ